MDCNIPGFPVLHCLLEFAQTYVHWVSDAIQPSHPLWSPSPPALNLSWHQVLFQWCLFALGWPKYWSFSFSTSIPIKFRAVPLGLTDLISLLPKRFSRVISSTTVLKHQFFDTQPCLWSNSHLYTWLLEKTLLWVYGPLLAKWCLFFLICCLGLSLLSFQGASYNFMAAVTVYNDLESQENKVCHCFLLFTMKG